MELREDEYPEMPRKVVDETLRLTKTKAILKDAYDDDSVEITRKKDGSINIVFRTHQDVTVEEVVECNLGHKHRQVVTKDYSYESINVSARHAKKLVEWLESPDEKST
jgi:hypothetical protein